MSGDAQSPIDFTGVPDGDLEPVRFHSTPSRLEYMDKSMIVRVHAVPPCALELDSTWYTLRQFHMHAPSEHRVGGWPAAMEIHLVHESEDERLAVVGVLVESGGSHPAVATLLRLLEGARGWNLETADAAFDPATLLPEDRTEYRYEGSLTTPPYTEGVRWCVLATPIEVSAYQLTALTRRFGLSARAVQPLNDRPVARVVPA